MGETEVAPISDELFRPSSLSLQFDHCTDDEIHVRFGVADDLSRRWLLRLDEDGQLLFLQGRGDPAAGMKAGDSWGGWATADGSGLRQAFPDYRSGRAGNPLRGTRVWRLELDPATDELVYYLDHGGESRFRLVFEPANASR